MTATSPRAPRARAGALLAAALLALPACSGGGSGAAKVPEPVAGRVVAFDGSTLGSEDLTSGLLSPARGLVTADRTGNVYVFAGAATHAPRIERITPDGVVQRYAELRTSVSITAFTVMKDGDIAFTGFSAMAGTAALYTADRDGLVKPVDALPGLVNPRVIGQWGDGALVVSDAKGLWEVGHGVATRLPGDGRNLGQGAGAVIDDLGDIYAVGDTLGATRVWRFGDYSGRLNVTGRTPDDLADFAKLKVLTSSPTSHGFYALASRDDGEPPFYAVHVARDGKATSLARLGGAREDCAVGRTYPAADNGCSGPGFLAENGPRLLLLGSYVPAPSAVPLVLVLPAVKRPESVDE